LLKNNNEKLELLSSFQKFIFDKQSAARGPLGPPLLRLCTHSSCCCQQL